MQPNNLIYMTLYELVNNTTKEGYVGITTRDPKKRWYEHLYDLRTNTHGNKRLQNAFNKYGELVFEFKIRSTHTTLDDLNKEETRVLVEEKDRLYNLAPGGNAFHHYLESKQKISKSQLKPVVGMCIKTGEIKRYASVMETSGDGFDFKSIGGACKLSTSLSAKGWVWMYEKDFSIEEMENRRKIAIRGKVRKERLVIGKSLKTGNILQFNSAQEAGRNGFSATSVYQACVGSRVKSHMRFVWVFGDIEDPQSLLELRYNEYLTNPPKTGPK